MKPASRICLLPDGVGPEDWSEALRTRLSKCRLPTTAAIPTDQWSRLNQWMFGAAAGDPPGLGALGALADGLLQSPEDDTLVAHFDPVSLRVDARSAVLLDARAFVISQEEAEALVAALESVLDAVGLTLRFRDPTRWYVLGDGLGSPALAEARLTPLPRAAGSEAHLALPQGPTGARWRALVNEVQMTLHEHPINQARLARGELPVNSVWPWGQGRLSALPAPTRRPSMLVGPDAAVTARGLAARFALDWTDIRHWQPDLAAKGQQDIVVCLPPMPLDALETHVHAQLDAGAELVAPEGRYRSRSRLRRALDRLPSAFRWRRHGR